MANRFKNSTTKVGQLLHRFCKRYVVGYEYEPYLTQNLKTVATFRYPSPGSTPVPAANDGDEKEWEFKTSRVQRTESVQEGTELDESNAFWPLKAVGKCTHQPLPLRFRKPHLYQENLDLYNKHGIARAGNYYLTEADVCYPEYENVHHDWDWEKNEHPNYGFESKEKILPC